MSIYHDSDFGKELEDFNKFLDQESTRRDVQTAILVQEIEDWPNEEMLASDLERNYDWNSNHAREVATAAWVEMYSEKEGE